MKKIIVSDYDNTLYLNEEDIKHNVDYINKYRNKNNLFVIATGRSFESLYIEIKKYNINSDYIILNHGTIILNKNFEIVYKELINKKDLAESLYYLKTTLNIKDHILYNELKQTKDSNDNISKIVIKFNSYEEINNVYNILIDKYKNKFNIYNINNNKIEIVPKLANKSNAINNIIKKENIERDYVYCIGDSSNDYEMLKEYNGFAMTNHEEILNEVTKTFYDSVSDFIEDIIKFDNIKTLKIERKD